MRKHFATAIVFTLSVASVARAAPDFTTRLQEADRLGWLTDWYSALPIYAEVEQTATKAGNRRDTLYAKFGRLRGQMQTLSLPDISEQIASDLESPLARRDARLRLRGLTVKGDIDLEWDILAAEHDWEEARRVAKEVGEKGWENRANGELGMIAFLQGNTGQATALVQQALQVATQSGDIGGQLRYMGSIANGLLLAGYAPLAIGYVDRALKFAGEHPETGFPFVAYSTKVLTLLELHQPNEAEQLARTAFAEARAGDRRIKEIELSMMLAQIAEKRGHPDEALEHNERAAATARAGHVQRLLADAESTLADRHRASGNLEQARRHAANAVAETKAAGSRFTLPDRLRVLGEIYAAQGKVAMANGVFEQAADIVEGIMVNVPSREAEARLVGVMSNVYAEHFRLVAEHIGDPARAYEIIERARGRAAADVLRTLPDRDARDGSDAGDQERVISRLQLRLMRARTPAERKQLLEQLWDAEQQARLQPNEPRLNLLVGKNRVGVRTVQRSLAPNEVILEYILGEPTSYCLAISRGRLKLFPLPSKTRIEELVDRFSQDLQTATSDAPRAAAGLFDTVLKPIADWQGVQRVFIVPDGKLHMLPFDTLMRLNAIQSRIVSIVPSAGVFFMLRNRAPASSTPVHPLLAVGGVPYDRMFATKSAVVATRSSESRGVLDATYPSQLSVLPTARGEVMTAARLLGPRSVVLTGDQATESTLKVQKLGEFEMLHFAVHAFADPKFPQRAALVLLNDPASGEDGLLQPREIGRFRLNAGAVVLSACDTAIGPTLGQEGVLNLARAFLLAGARSVVTTLWTVSDATSTALMRRFYENIAAGHDVAEALMLSKATVLEQFGSEALGTVAAFQIVGIGDHRVAASEVTEKPTGRSSGR